ncbi:homoserine/Threonine efflux protein [Raoultella planticola]|uniref:Homoserine/Threonine efflux protein n=1 Tax=Raoultella planticola TaxID=575 RepID=A0A485AEU8_RAOPL|nr:homoserine/Threonine efflux protein [Raoultella planticola]
MLARLQLLLRPRQAFDTHQPAAPSTSNWFLKGMLGNVLNPKMGVFYVSFLPQFIPAGHSPIIWTFLLVANPCVNRYAVVINPDPGNPLRLRIAQKAALYPMDGSRHRRGIYALCRRLALSHRYRYGGCKPRIYPSH